MKEETCQSCFNVYLAESVRDGICRACRIVSEIKREEQGHPEAIKALEDLADFTGLELDDVGDDIYARRRPAESRRKPPKSCEPQNGCSYKRGRSCVYCAQPIADLAPEVPYDELDAHWRCTRKAIHGEEI